MALFNEAAAAVRGRLSIPIKHIAATAAAIVFPESLCGLIRMGIGLYGLWPSKETYLSCRLRKRRPFVLKPVLSWQARIAQIRRLSKGRSSGTGAHTGRPGRRGWPSFRSDTPTATTGACRTPPTFFSAESGPSSGAGSR